MPDTDPATRPPRLAEGLLSACLPPGMVRQTVLGDLREEYAERLAGGAVRKARAWYRRQAVSVAVAYLAGRASHRGVHNRLRHVHSNQSVRPPTGDPFMTQLIQHVRHALRGFARSPGFTTIAALTLALGIGANAAIFSVVNGVLLRPLPYEDPGRLVSVWHEIPGFGVERFPAASDALFVHYRNRSRSFESLAAWSPTGQRVTGGESPELVVGARITENLLATLGRPPAMGRGFTEADAQPQGPAVAILGHGLWVRHFASDPRILGRTIEIDERPVEIVGVMAEDFRFLRPTVEILRPLTIDEDALTATGFNYQVIGRLAPGIRILDASAEVDALVSSLPETDPNGFFTAENIEQGGLKAFLNSSMDDVVGSIRSTLWILLGTVGFVLVIACANVANLFLVRSEGRQKEVALRTALGASRGHLIGRFLTESVLLGLVGGMVGLALAYAGTRALVAFGPTQLPRLEEIGVDGTVLAFTAGISVLAGLLFGALPVLRLSARPLASTLNQEGRGGTAGKDPQRARSLLVMAQVAMALMLLIGSGLMIRSFQELRAVDPGFNAEGVLTFGLNLPASSYVDDDAVAGFYQQLIDRLASLPGATSAGAAAESPLSANNRTPVIPEGMELEPGSVGPVVIGRVVSPGYIETMEIRLLAGRTFERADHETRAGSVIVNESFAEQFWPGEVVIGMRLLSSPDGSGPHLHDRRGGCRRPG